MVVGERFRTGGNQALRLLRRLQVVERLLQLEEEFVGHGLCEAMTDEDALDYEVFSIGRHGIGGDEPTAIAQSIGHVVEREGGGCGILELPAEARDASVAVVDDFK